MARGNGEGTVYETVQKIKKDFDNTKMCTICRNCTDRSICEQRESWIKCDKCKKCEGKDCDRFYIYKKTFAQVSTKTGRKTIGSAKTKKEANKKKDKAEELLKLDENIKGGQETLENTMLKNEREKLRLNTINENSFLRNKSTIDAINKHPASQKKMIEITEDDIKDILAFFIDSGASQSQLSKVFDEMKTAFKYCGLKTMDNLKRDSFSSKMQKKEIIAFTLEEEQQLIAYINKNEDKLVDEKRSKIDKKTVKNIIKFAFATGMRIGEICSLNRKTDINKETKKAIVRTTLTKNIDGKIVLGKGTKTARKNRKSGKNNTRYVPLNVLFPDADVLEIINEQNRVAEKIENNTNDLLFCNRDGTFISHSGFNAIFKKICREAGVKLELASGCNMHMTKHTAITRMIENGIRIEVISVIVGTSVEVLRKTYAHILDDFIEKEIESSIKNRPNNLSLN